jgi:hypothetical protein
MNKIILYIALLFIYKNSFAQKLEVADLQCEHMNIPMGIDVQHPNLSWKIFSNQKNVIQKAYRIIITDNDADAKNYNGTIWDTKKVISNNSINNPYSGKKLLPATKYYWRVMVWDNKGNKEWSEIYSWQTGLFAVADWQGAKWIAYENINDTAIIVPAVHGGGKKTWGKRLNVIPQFRKLKYLTKSIKSATAYVAGLGHFEMYINGKNIAPNNFMQPGWTNYSKQANYVALDVGKFLNYGNNTIATIVGNGFYYIPSQRYRKITGAFGLPKLICTIKIIYADDAVEYITSNETWKTIASPITFSSIYGGEDYDARLEQKNWMQNDFDDSKWKTVVLATPHNLQWEAMPPVVAKEEFIANKIKQLNATNFIYDIHQNLSGIPNITVKGNKGDTIKITPAELLNADSSVNQKNSGSTHNYIYVLNGDGFENWQPKFTYYGFRYLQVEILPRSKDDEEALAKIITVKAIHIRTDNKTTGIFNCSNEIFNKTNELIKWAVKSNMVSVFTDCPHREKLGWLEQNHLMGASVQYNFEIAAMGNKIMNDIRLAQTDSGMIPTIAPEYVQFETPFRDSPEWGSAGIIFAWYLYQWYGDITYLKNYYAMMQRYMQYLQAKSNNYMLTYGLGDWYDLGPYKPGFSQLTSAGITATATYYYNATLMQKIASLLHLKNDVALYKMLAFKIKNAFNQKFYNVEKKYYDTNSQTANAMALYFGIVAKENENAVLQNLIADIENRNFALTTGDIGYRYLLKALAQYNRHDIIYKMNNRDDVPGYGYQIKKAATALTESWQALPTVSNNHFMLGHLMEWFYEGLAGIQQDANSVGYKNIVIKPAIITGVTNVFGTFTTPYGNLISSYVIKENIFYLEVFIPVNTTAIIYLPKNTKGIKRGSGNYQFKLEL